MSVTVTTDEQYTKSVVVSLLVALSYVVSIYIGVSGTQITNRNDPKVMRSRIFRASIATWANILFVPLILVRYVGTYESYTEALYAMGLIPGLQRDKQIDISRMIETAIDILRVLLLFAGLFIGPLVESVSWYVSPSWDWQAVKEDFADFFAPSERLRMLRDLIFAPITEEVIYTSCIMAIYIPLVHSGAADKTKVICLTPLLFGLAHIHHGYLMYHTKFNKQIIPVILTVLFQLLYTSIFGIMTNFVFVRTGSVWCCIASHCFCNFMGAPIIVPQANKLDWKISYWCLLVGGMVFFKKFSMVLTESSNALL